MSGWQLSPFALALAAAALVRFGHAFARLRRRGRHDHAGWDRPVLFAAGLALAVVPLSLPRLGSSLPGHMLEHLLLGDVAAALILLALRGPLLFFMVPALAARSVARRAPLRRAAALLARPSVALGVWVAVLAGWHVPGAYDYAVAHEAAHVLQHVSFVVAGFLVWAQLVDPAGRRALSVGGRLAFAGALFVSGQILADVLLVAPEPLYASYAADPSALADQQLAGVVMMLEQLLTLGALAVLLVRSCLHTPAGPGAAARV
jgi:cytochrome c oxidase assembly factor CtaG